MKRIISTTDGKYVGVLIDEEASVIVFENGEEFRVERKQNNNDGTIVLANSNYQITLGE
jgi:hypothetical protein